MSGPRVAVVTDSTACLPGDLARELGIRVLPVDLVFQGRVYRDGLDSNPGEFYALLKAARQLPTTSPPSPGSYLEAFKEAGQGQEGVLCLTVSSRVSAMFDSARLAQDMAREMGVRVEVLDSRTAAMAQGFVVLEAARAAATGKGLEEVEAAAREVMAKVRIVAVLDTLYYLAKGGRIPRAAAWMGSLLRIKPIFEFYGGEACFLERARTRPRAQARLLDLVERKLEGKPAHMSVLHAHAPQEAQVLKGKVQARFQCRELHVTEFTPVMGAHTGPGLLGLAFYPD